ncbi:MAG: class I SAM-dependent methyltransferase [Candidatus Aenigmatarchaeota archaeon]
MAALLTPEWQEKVRGSYRPHSLDMISDVSYPDRHLKVDDYLDGFLHNVGGEMNALLVGVGKKSAQDKTCAIRHVELARKFAEYEKDFVVHVLDVDAAALEEARERGGLRTNCVQGDIVTADLSGLGPFHYVECLNVFEHIGNGSDTDIDGQRLLAVANMAKNMNRGGLMVIDNIKNSQWAGLTAPDNDGTNMNVIVSEAAMKELDIGLEYRADVSRSRSYLFYRKQ